jgi:hypothetical protein
MGEARDVVSLSTANCYLEEKYGKWSGWIETTIKYWYDNRIYICRDGRVGHHYEIPYGYSTGPFTASDLHNAGYTDAVNSAVSKLPKLVEELEEHIYSIADSIED